MELKVFLLGQTPLLSVERTADKVLSRTGPYAQCHCLIFKQTLFQILKHRCKFCFHMSTLRSMCYDLFSISQHYPGALTLERRPKQNCCYHSRKIRYSSEHAGLMQSSLGQLTTLKTSILKVNFWTIKSIPKYKQDPTNTSHLSEQKSIVPIT